MLTLLAVRQRFRSRQAQRTRPGLHAYHSFRSLENNASYFFRTPCDVEESPVWALGIVRTRHGSSDTNQMARHVQDAVV